MVVLKQKMSHLLPLNTEPNFLLFEKWLHLKQNLTAWFVFVYVECYYQEKFK